jgi:uncharacterized sporulation protein YeaH/YhbH (DUF444 family)
MPVFRDGRSIPIDFTFEIKRHEEKLLKALRERLWELIEDIQLIGPGKNDPNRLIKIRIRGVKEFRFKFVEPGSGVGQLGEDEGVQGTEKGVRGGETAGTEPGEKEYDEYEIDRTQLQDMLFERWNLPPPEPREVGPLEHEKELRLRGLRRKGVRQHLAKRETTRVRFKRLVEERANSQDENAEDENSLIEAWQRAPFREEDLRYWRFEKEEEGTKAVQYCLRDISGSMSGSKQEACRVLFTYICCYRERKFPEFEARYIVHTTDAEETDELEFFRRSATGGTKMSSSLELMLQLLRLHHNPDEWNIYGMYASDGENQSDDNALVVSLVNEILDVARLFVYLETFLEGQQTESPLYDELMRLSQRRRNLVVTRIYGDSPSQVKRALDEIFEREWEVESNESR